MLSVNPCPPLFPPPPRERKKEEKGERLSNGK